MIAHAVELVRDEAVVGVVDAVIRQPPVPVRVRRATGLDEPAIASRDLYAGLSPRVAVILIAIYMDPGALVVDPICGSA